MNSIFKILYLFIFNIACCLYSYAQTYPVTLNTQLMPPFSGYLPDYSAAGNEKLKVLLTFNDFSKPNYQVKLKIKIEGQGITIQSKPFYFEGPFMLDPGVPLFLSGSDLGNLLNSNNLDFSGISKAQYEQRKVLPEGFYSICITAYDNNNPNPIAVSNTSCAYGMMVISDPPYLNLPFCGSSVTQTNPQQITFNWTPINQASPNSAGQTDYVFELFEIRPSGQNPNSIVQTLPPIYTETLSTTSLNYGITETPLINAMDYVWRVRAIDQSGRDLFKNQGYSQICTFSYGNSYSGANLNINLTAQAVSHRQIKAQWDSLNLYSYYKLEFQKVGGTSTWFPVNTANARTRITSLEPNTSYKLRVKGMLPDGSWGPLSNEVTVSTSNIPNYACGEVVSPFNMQGFVPLTNATAGMIWDIGQFEVIVTSLQNPMSPTGQYSGTGRVRVGFAGGIPFPVSFTGITVSDDMRIVAGKVDVISRGIDAWLNQMNAGFFNAGNEETEYVTSSTSTVVTVNTGNGTINVGGDSFGLDNTYGNTITNGSGDITVVTPGGQVICVGSTSGTPIPDNKKYINSTVGNAQFSAASDQLYGYDKFQFTQWNNWYEKTFDVATNALIPVDWKSLQAKKYDRAEITIQFNGTTLNPDSVFARTATGTIYKQQKLNGKRYFYFVGSENKKSQELFASIRMGDSIVNIGKLNTINYDLQIKTLNLVPFNNTKALNASALEGQLNRAYRQALIKWTVAIQPALTVSNSDWDLNGNNKLNCGSSLFAKYSGEMQKINSNLLAQSYFNDDEFYIIASGIAPDSLQNGLLGEMPRNRNIGYVFTNTNPGDSLFAQIAAHELGHGYATLEHSFPEIPTASSQNLMDYPSGVNMARFQWDLCQDPNGLSGMLDGNSNNSYKGCNETTASLTYGIILTKLSNCISNCPTPAQGNTSNNYCPGRHDLTFYINDACAEALAKLTNEERHNILKNISDGFNYVTSNLHSVEESSIIRLLGFMPKTKANSEYIIEKLAENNFSLLQKLRTGIDGENYNLLIALITQLAEKAKPYVENAPINLDEQIFKWNGSNGGINFTIQFNQQGLLSAVIHTNTSLGYKNVTVNPFNYVGILSKVKLPGIKNSFNGRYYTAIVPAIYLQWLFDKGESEAATKLTFSAASVLTLQGGIGIAINSTNALVKVFGILEATSGISSIALDNTPLENAIVSKYGTAGQNFIDDIRFCLNMYNLASGTGHLIKLTTSYARAKGFWITNRSQIRNENTIPHAEFEDFDSFLNESRLGSVGDNLITINGIEYIANKFGKNNVSVYIRKNATSVDYYFPDNTTQAFASFQVETRTFKPAIEIPENLRGQGVGSGVFNDAFDRLGGHSSIDDIESSWSGTGTMTDNFKSFKDALISGLPEKAAAFSTATGQWAKALGFKNVLIPPGKSQQVLNNQISVISPMFIP